MRRAAKVDANQPAVVEALRKAGCVVQPLHMVGKGCPDVLVGKGERMWLMEIKDGSKPPSARKLTPDEEAWHRRWSGHVVVIESPEQALEVVSR